MNMEIWQCKFHMIITEQLTSDNFKTSSIQLDCQGVMDINSNPNRYSGIYKELADLVGDAATLKIWKHFSGLTIAFPQKLYSKEFRRDYIVKNMDEMRPADMARALGLSERRIRQIITEIRNEG